MKKPGRIMGRILIGLVVLAVAVLAASGVIGSRMNKKDNSGFSADLLGYENARFAAAGSGFAAVSDISCRLYGRSGETLCTASRSYTELQIAGAESCAAVWSEGGAGITFLRPEGAADLNFSGGVTAADMNDEGTAVVLAGEIGYKGSVTVIDKLNSEVYRVYVGSGYPMDADISPDSRRVAILSLTAEGSSVTVYNTDSEKLYAEYRSEGRSCFDLEYLSDGRLMLVSTDGAAFLKDDGKLLGELSFDGEYLKGYASGEGFAVLLLGRYKAGNTGRILMADTAGNLLRSLEISAETESVSAAGKYIAVRYADETVLYDDEFRVTGSLEDTAGIQAAVMRSDGSAVIISGGRAAVYEP
jgi:hypothetical protein